MQTRWLDLRAFLRPGDRIVWGQACGEPTTLVEALIAQADSIGRLSAFAATAEVNERVCQLVQAAAAKLRDLILAREPGTHVISTERAIHCRRTGRMIRERDT
jgi:hypothetical protein